MRLTLAITLALATAGCSVLKNAAPPRPAPFRGGLAFVDATRHVSQSDDVVVKAADQRDLRIQWSAVAPATVRLVGEWHVPCETWTSQEQSVALEPGWATRLAARILARRADDEMYRHDPMRWMIDPSRPPVLWGNDLVHSGAGAAQCPIGPAAYAELEVRYDDGTRATVSLDREGVATVPVTREAVVVGPGTSGGVWVVRVGGPVLPGG